jgi:hypothetical protein
MADQQFTRGLTVALVIWMSCAKAHCGEINDAARTGDLAKEGGGIAQGKSGPGFEPGI